MSTRLKNKWNPLIVEISHRYEITKDFLKTCQSHLWKYIFKQDDNQSIMWSQPRNLENIPFTFYTVFLHTKHRKGSSGGLGKRDATKQGQTGRAPEQGLRHLRSQHSGQSPDGPQGNVILWLHVYLSTSVYKWLLIRPWESQQPIPPKFPAHLTFFIIC